MSNEIQVSRFNIEDHFELGIPPVEIKIIKSIEIKASASVTNNNNQPLTSIG